MSNTIEEIFKIDKIGKGIVVKILFAFLVMLRIFVNTFPIGDNNFDNLYGYMNTIIENPELAHTANISDIPISDGNMVFIGSILAVEFLAICSYYLYVGLMIRDMRKGDERFLPIAPSKLFVRLFILICVSFILFFLAMILLLYFFIFFIIIFPWLFMYPACYLSGDSGFFMSFAAVFKKSRGYYFVNVRNLAVVMLASLLLQWIAVILGNVYEPISVVLDAFIFVFTLFCVARYSGLIYRRMLMFPERKNTPIEPYN